VIGRGVDRQRINQDLVYRSKGGELEDHESLKCRLPSVFNLANHAGDIKAPIRFALFGQPFQPDINPPGVSIPEGEPVLDIFFQRTSSMVYSIGIMASMNLPMSRPMASC
jgi:hypothetical protein